MSVRRVVPNIHSQSLAESRAFYSLLGLEEAMNLGWIITLASSTTAQLSLLTEDRTAPVVPDISIEVDNVDTTYQALQAHGAEIVHPLQNEEWGVRRFFTRDPNARVINVLSHR